MNLHLSTAQRFFGAALLAASFLAVTVSPAPAQTTKDEAKPAAKAAAKAKVPTGPPIPPTYGNVAYGDHPRQVLDFYKAETKEPAPLVVFIHGGGWVNGDKYGVDAKFIKDLQDEGISVAAINYRYTTQADEAGIKPPVKWPLEDAARAIQFLRSKAGEWNIDKTRIGATGRLGRCLLIALAGPARRHGPARQPRPDRPRVDPSDLRSGQRRPDVARPQAAPLVDAQHALRRPRLRLPPARCRRAVTRSSSGSTTTATRCCP